MANIDNAYGFRYDVNLNDESPPVKDFEIANTEVLNEGDPVTMTGGYILKAVTTDPILGVYMGPAAVDDAVQDGAPQTGDGTQKGKILLALEGMVFRVQDANATPTIANRGESVDFSGASGAVVITTGVVGVDCFVLDKAGIDNIAGNEYGASMDWLVTFLNRQIG